ncbi:MAG: hypothetical protein JRJ29_21180, partial [Deltaproteobacteria bacterium]|nr:hypothetical protein [Deltaproteobacteria bacterium]
NGVLVDFSPTELAVRVKPEEHSSFLWFRQDEPVTLWLQDESHTVFSGTCKCIREGDEGERRVLVLQPGEQRIQRYPVRRIRNPRRQLVPSPSLAFEHPLLKRWIQLEVSNLSSSGFCVKEARDEAVLMPGLILPEVNIQVADALQLRCKAQVIYSFPETQETLRCGLAILDMEIADYTRLSHLIASAVDPHAFLSCQVDLDALWEFFFEAGFIYPKKYSLIHAHKEEFKKTYQKLYMDSPSIARHFTCQRNGRIYGHIAMVRAYERSWMIHHHAARSSEGRRAGFLVLTHLMHYINDIHRFPSIDMRYVMSYFRPENRFPKEVFGGFSETLKDPQGCSQDLFAYLPHTSLSLERGLPEPWSLRGSLEKDLVELNHFYRYRSGGLLLEAMNLGREGSRGESLFELYKEEGFFRKRSCYSLCHGDQARAIFVLDQSDLGLNLSELLNSIKIFILEQEEVPWNILSMAIGPMTKLYRIQKVPIMFYPAEYMVLHRLPYEKTYEAWVLDVQHGNAYMEYMQKRFRVGYGEQGGQK